MASKQDGVWVITHRGDLIRCLGSKIIDNDRGMYGQCFLVLLTTDGKEHPLATDDYWSGKTGPVEELRRAQEIIVGQITKCKEGKLDLRENKKLMNLLKSLE